MPDPGTRPAELSRAFRDWIAQVIRDLRTGSVTPAEAEENVKIICKLSPVIEVHGKSPGSSPEVHRKSTPSLLGETFKEGGLPKKASRSRSSSSSSNRPVEPAEGFDLFWEIYPRKIGKQAAIKAWNGLSLEDRRAAYKSAKVRTEQDKTWIKLMVDGDFKLHPSTFLNGRRWEDEWDKEPQIRVQARSGGQGDQGYRCPAGCGSYANLGAYGVHLDDAHDGKEPYV